MRVLRFMVTAVLMSTPAVAWDDGNPTNPGTEPDDPTADPEYQRILRLRAAYDDLVHKVLTHDDYAGFKGEIYIPAMPRLMVDRSLEARKKPGLPPSRIDAIDSVLRNVNASARGQIKINITRTYYSDGTLKSEEYLIDIGGNWNVGQGSMDEAKAKQHE